MSQPIDTRRSPDRLPSSDERVLAGVSHLAICGGFWLIAPLAIFLVKRKDSPFVAFHALQATLLALAAVPLGIASWLLALVVSVAGALLLGQDAAAVLPVLWLGPLLLPMLLVGATGVVAGVRAFHGRTWAIPVIGRFARAILAEPKRWDPLAPAPVSPRA